MRKCSLYLVSVLLLGTVCAFGQLPTVDNGIIDLRNWDLAHKRIAINGEWHYYKNQLISTFTGSHNQYINFPSTWSEGQGFSSYSVKMVTLRGQKKLALSIPQIYSNYELYVDGNRIATNGTVGSSLENSKPQWLPQMVSFETAGDTIELFLTVSNFHHFKGGVKEPIYFGATDLLYQFHRTSRVSNLTEAVTLFLLGVGFFIIFLFHDQKKIILYFFLLCISWSIRSVFSNQYLFIQNFPDFDWNWMVRIEYITLFTTMMWGILFLSRLFTHEGIQSVKYIFVTANCIFIGFTVFTPPLLFTRWLNVYLVFAGILLIYGAIVVIRALINERVGAWYLTISILLAVGIFTYDISAFEGWFSYNPIFFSTGYILIFMAMSLALLYSLNIIKSKAKTPNMLRYEDFFSDKD